MTLFFKAGTTYGRIFLLSAKTDYERSMWESIDMKYPVEISTTTLLSSVIYCILGAAFALLPITVENIQHDPPKNCLKQTIYIYYSDF